MEDRQLMCAGGVAYNAMDDSLRISEGNNANETVVVSSDSDARGIDRVHVKCSVNGQTKYTTTFAEDSYDDIKKVHWNAGNGHNMFVNNSHVRSVVSGGSGDDIFFGVSSVDSFFSGGGTDKLSGNGGNDNLYGGPGTDYLWGNAGTDNLHGGDGRDELHGGSGVDYLRGNDGNDFLWGDESNDHLWGGDGNDVLRGEVGHDKLYGESRADVLLGGDGNDDLHGGNDGYVDKLWGQAGQDDFFIEQEYVLASWNNGPVFKW